jgi:glutamate racemase
MRIGIFDSGLGGLAVARAIFDRLPQYDYLYLGDTKRVPYGGRSQEAIHEFVSQALDFLFANDCHLVVLACNTASAEALRKSQQEYLPNTYPDRRVLGVVIPCAEAVCELGVQKVAVIGTLSTIASGAYSRELDRQRPGLSVQQVATPLLVPMIEGGAIHYIAPILHDYLAQVSQSEALVLGCTHYGLIKEEIRAAYSGTVITSDEVIPPKLESYLSRHPEHDAKLSRTGTRRFCVTDIGPGYESLTCDLFGQALDLELVTI